MDKHLKKNGNSGVLQLLRSQSTDTYSKSYICNRDRRETRVTRELRHVCAKHAVFFPHKCSSTQRSPPCRYTGHLANILPRQCLTLLTVDGCSWPLAVNTLGVESITMVRGLDPLPVPGASWGPASCLVNPLYGFTGGPCRSGLPYCPSGADPGSVNGPRPEVSPGSRPL